MRLEVTHLSKTYGKVLRVLKDVSLCVNAGEICGIFGENGSGKSTVARILTGKVLLDHGQCHLLQGAHVSDLQSTPGLVAYIPQSPAFVPFCPAADNIFLAHGSTWSWRSKSMRNRERDEIRIWERILFPLPQGNALEWQNKADLAKVAIVRALVRDSPVLVVDEATADLDEADSLRFLRFLRRYADEGRVVVLISHDPGEIERYCDRAYAFVDGVAWPVPPKREELSSIVFGEQVEWTPVGLLRRDSEDYVLVIEGIPALGDSILREPVGVRRGQIVVLAGLSLSGQEELFASLCHPGNGPLKIRLHSKDAAEWNNRQRRRAGMCFIPPTRIGGGLIGEFTCEENLLLGLARGCWWRFPITGRRRAEELRSILRNFEVRKELTELAGNLSGGNQQKLLLARELGNLIPREACVIASNPCTGIDLATRQVIYAKLRRIAENGGSVFLITTDPDDASIGDRVLVLKSFRIVADLDAPVDRKELIEMILN